MILSREGDIWCIYAQARLMVVHEFLFTFHRGHAYLYGLQWSMLGHGTDKGFPWIFAVFIFFLKEKKGIYNNYLSPLLPPPNNHITCIQII